MRKTMFILVVAAMVIATPLFAQTVIERHDFSSMGNWVPGPGNWSVSGNRLHQNDARAALARVDKSLVQQGVYQIDFNIRYADGGYRSAQDLRNQHLHAGFGVQLGVSNPPLRRTAWGLGESYLLWLNLDTRPDTRRNYPHHFGVRAQVYESRSLTSMDLLRGPSVEALLGSPVMSVDIAEALYREFGYVLNVGDVLPYLYSEFPISIRVNTRTGEIGVKDPTAPIRFYFTLDPSVLRGDYIALRTNGLAANFSNFVVTSR